MDLPGSKKIDGALFYIVLLKINDIAPCTKYITADKTNADEGKSYPYACPKILKVKNGDVLDYVLLAV